MELQQLRYFKVIAECENMSRAAEKLYVSQPALTKIIQRLEADLEVPLFERKGRSIQLNEYGRTVLEYTDHIFQNIEGMRQALQKQKSAEDGMTLISDLPNIIRYIMPSYLQENDPVKMEVKYREQISEPLELLKNGVCDMVITDHAEAGDGFQSVLLLQDHLLAALPSGHPLAQKGWVDYRDLDGIRMIEQKSMQKMRSLQIIKEILKRNQVKVTYIPTLDVGSQQFLLETTDYITITSTMTSLYWMPENRKCVPIRGADARIDYYMICGTEPSETCKKFMEWLKNWGMWAEQMARSKFPLEKLWVSDKA